MIGCFAGEMIAGGHDRDYDTVAGAHFLDVGDAFFVARDGIGIVFVVSGEHHDWQILIDHRVRPVLHFAGGIALRVNFGNFLYLVRHFPLDPVCAAPPHPTHTTLSSAFAPHP